MKSRRMLVMEHAEPWEVFHDYATVNIASIAGYSLTEHILFLTACKTSKMKKRQIAFLTLSLVYLVVLCVFTVMVKEMRLQHVTHLLKRCESQIHTLVPALVTAAQGSASNSQKVAKETELRFWEWRQRLLAKMKACFELAKAPDPPSKVEISVVSSTSVKVAFSPPKNTNGSLVTRYKREY